MNSASAGWLLLTAIAPLLSAVLVMVATVSGRRSLALIVTWIAVASMTLGSATVTGLLASANDPAGTELEIPLWTWLSLNAPMSAAVTFGLEATPLKSGLVCAIGVVVLFLLGVGCRRGKAAFSLDAIAATNGICVGAIAFLFAPNLAQALLGWAVGSLSAAILIRLSHALMTPAPGSSIEGRPALLAPPGSKHVAVSVDPRLYRLSSTISLCEHAFHERIWQPLTCRFPNWIGEQVEFLESRPTSIPLLAGALGAFAILLTWLLGGS